MTEYLQVTTGDRPVGEVIRRVGDHVYMRKINERGQVEQNHLLYIPLADCQPLELDEPRKLRRAA